MILHFLGHIDSCPASGVKKLMRSYLIRIFVLLIVLALNGCKGCKDGSSERTSSKSVTADASEKKQSDSVLNRKHGGTLASVRMEAGVELEANEAIGSEKASDPIEKAVYIVNNDDQDELKEFPGQYERQENADRRDKDVGTDAVVETIGENEEAESRTPNKDDETEIDEEEEPAVQILSDKESETENLNEEEEVADSNAIGDAHVDRGSGIIGEIAPISDANKGDLEIVRQENAKKEKVGGTDAQNEEDEEGNSEYEKERDPVPIMKSDSSGKDERWSYPVYNFLKRTVSSTSKLVKESLIGLQKNSREYLDALRNTNLTLGKKIAILTAVLGAVLVVLDYNGIDFGIASQIKSILTLKKDDKLLEKLFEAAKSVPQAVYARVFGANVKPAETNVQIHSEYFLHRLNMASQEGKNAAFLEKYLKTAADKSSPLYKSAEAFGNTISAKSDDNGNLIYPNIAEFFASPDWNKMKNSIEAL